MEKKANEIEMKNDGKDLERFSKLLAKVVAVPKEEVKKHEASKQNKRAKKS